MGVGYSTWSYWRRKYEGKEPVHELAPISISKSRHPTTFSYTDESVPTGTTLLFPNGLREEFGGDHHEDGHVTTLDVAKRLLDYGFHAPTIYFPLLFHEALMIEPTETESKDTLDDFIEVMKKIAVEARDEREMVLSAPHSTPVRRLDDVKAVKEPKFTYKAL